MALMTALVFMNVVGRYGFGYSFSWAEELSRYIMIWTTFLGLGLALRYGQLVAVDLVQDMLPSKGALLFRIGIVLAIVFFLTMLLIYGTLFVGSSWNTLTPVLRVPRAVPYMAMPIGAGLALIHLTLSLPSFLRRDWLSFPDLDSFFSVETDGQRKETEG